MGDVVHSLVIIAGLCAGILFDYLFPRRRRITAFKMHLKPLRNPLFKHNISTIDLNSDTEEEYTYLYLIQETLRLYPVVKRIKRSSTWETIAIDIEQIHKETWSKADVFDSNRWMTGMRGGYLPFGRGRGRCIASEPIVGMVVCIVLGAMETQLEKVGGLHFEELVSNGRVGNSL